MAFRELLTNLYQSGESKITNAGSETALHTVNMTFGINYFFFIFQINLVFYKKSN